MSLFRVARVLYPLAIGSAPTIAAVGLAGVAQADPIPFPDLLGGAALPADLAQVINPGPEGLQQPSEPPFRADATTPPSAASGAGPLGFLSGVWQSQNLLRDMGGLRPALSKYGVTLSILENVETFGNVTGGTRQGFEINGLTTATVQLDTEKAFGLKGGLFNVSGLQIWGGDLTANNLLILQSASDIEAPVGIRLWELWYQQKFSDKFDIKLGQQSLDEEFILSPSAYFFINAASGWPALPSNNLPGGGPAYPLAALGGRARAQVSHNVAVLAGVFNGSPIPLNSPNTPLSNPNGVSFPLNTGVFAIAELQYTFPAATPSGKAAADGPLPGTYKIGAWYDSEDFDSQQYDTVGVPLASPESNGMPAQRQGNYAIYAVADQMIWRASDPNRNVSAFIRPMFTTLQDRNLISFSVNGGLTLHDPLPGRDNDVFGLGFGVAQVSKGAANNDRALQVFEPTVYTPVRGTETFLEATYQAQILPSLQIQPDVQYIINPGGGLANPDEPYQKIKNEFVVGLRTNITF